MIHEQNGVLGRVNTVFARRVDKVACGTWPTALPAGVEAVYTGNPVRAAVLERAGAIMLREDQLDAAALWTQIAAVLDDPQAAEQMARKAQAQGRPDATERLVALVESLARASGQ